MSPTPVMLTTPQGLYMDEAGRRISTHSMLKTFRACPMQAFFKYHLRLKPRLLGSPLKRGTWVHALLEVLHSPEYKTREEAIEAMWAMHEKLSAQFEQLFDEEKDHYGNMPVEIRQVMKGYLWHYHDDPWIVHEVEFTLETELPDGSIYRGKIDALIENQWGLWLVDHKSHQQLPSHDFRVLDTQSPLYLKAAWMNKIPVHGFIWNYVRWKMPTVPELVYRGKKNQRISLKSIETDYVTYVTAIKRYQKENGLTITPEMKAYAQVLKNLRYRPGEPQQSPFFRRDVMEKSPEMIERVWKAATHSSTRMHTYDFTDVDSVERVVGRHCDFCSYTDVCAAQLQGYNMKSLVRQNYKVGDPNDYYNDKAGDLAGKE